MSYVNYQRLIPEQHVPCHNTSLAGENVLHYKPFASSMHLYHRSLVGKQFATTYSIFSCLTSKALDTFGNIVKDSHLVYLKCITKCENLNSIGRRNCERIIEEKRHCHKRCVLSDALNSIPQLRSRNQLKYFSEKLLFSQKLRYSIERVVSHNVLFYQQLSIARYRVMFCAKNYNYQWCPLPLKINSQHLELLIDNKENKTNKL